MPFGSTQPSQNCVHDTDQLVELPLIGMTDAAAQKNPVINSYDRAVPRTLVRTLARVHHTTPCRAMQRSHGPPDGLLSQRNAWSGLRPRGSARNQLAFPRRGVSCFARSDSRAAKSGTRIQVYKGQWLPPQLAERDWAGVKVTIGCFHVAETPGPLPHATGAEPSRRHQVHRKHEAHRCMRQQAMGHHMGKYTWLTGACGRGWGIAEVG